MNGVKCIASNEKEQQQKKRAKIDFVFFFFFLQFSIRTKFIFEFFVLQCPKSINLLEIIQEQTMPLTQFKIYYLYVPLIAASKSGWNGRKMKEHEKNVKTIMIRLRPKFYQQQFFPSDKTLYMIHTVCIRIQTKCFRNILPFLLLHVPDMLEKFVELKQDEL